MTYIEESSLTKKKVIIARKLEIEYYRKMGVYEKVHKRDAKGHKLITTRWVDTDKGDKDNPDYRSRRVGREIKKDNRLDLFSATPPLETLKALMSICAQGQKRVRPLRYPHSHRR